MHENTRALHKLLGSPDKLSFNLFSYYPPIMKIIEAQSAVLSNYEVYKNLVEQKEKYKKIKRRGPPNLETVVREVRARLHNFTLQHTNLA